MTDARLPDRWLTDRRLQRLSDSHFRAFVNGLLWSVSNRTDGVIEIDDLALIPRFPAGVVQTLVDAGLWAPQSGGWVIADFAATQTSRDQHEAMEKIRSRERQKKAAQRAAKAGGETPSTQSCPGDSPGDSPGELSRGLSAGLHRTGQDRTGKALKASGSGTDPREHSAGPRAASGISSPETCVACGQRPAQGPGAWESDICTDCAEARTLQARNW